MLQQVLTLQKNPSNQRFRKRNEIIFTYEITNNRDIFDFIPKPRIVVTLLDIYENGLGVFMQLGCIIFFKNVFWSWQIICNIWNDKEVYLHHCTSLSIEASSSNHGMTIFIWNRQSFLEELLPPFLSFHVKWITSCESWSVGTERCSAAARRPGDVVVPSRGDKVIGNLQRIVEN